MENGFKISINQNPECRYGVDIRIGLFREGELYVAEPITMKFNRHVPGERVKATLELNHHEGIRFLDALKEALNQHNGIKADSIEGELKATKEHLSDLKTILFDHMGVNSRATRPTATSHAPLGPQYKVPPSKLGGIFGRNQA